MKYDVFISHSSKDKIVADQLCEYLENNGINCWIAPRNVTAGLPYARAILQGIDDSTLMVLLFSDNSNRSRHVESEVDRAFNKEKVIIPFRIVDIAMSDVLSYYLGASHYIDGIPNPTSAFEKLKNQIERNLPSRRDKMDIEEILSKLAELKGVSVEEVRNAIEGLRKSETDSFEDLLEEFLKIERDVRKEGNGPLSNEIGAQGAYSILQNANGEIMVMISSREGEPDNPHFIYDGKDTALLYRSPESSMAFRHIDEGAKEPLRNVKEVLIVEIEDDDVAREYNAPVRMVNDVNKLIIQ